jgi:hypothetical protein
VLVVVVIDDNYARFLPFAMPDCNPCDPCLCHCIFPACWRFWCVYKGKRDSIDSAGAFTKPGGLDGLSNSKCRSPRRLEALATTGGTALLWLGTKCAQPQSIAPPVG